MSPWLIALLVILTVLVVGFTVLMIVGRRMQKKQEAAMPDIKAGAQQISMLIIDKKKIKLKEAGFPSIVLEQTPKYMRGAKVPVVKAKVGPRVMNLMCDDKIFDDVPVKKEVKALVNGIYIIEVKGLRNNGPVEEEKKGFFGRAKKEARKMAAEKAKKKSNKK
ncbi:MAG: hypothetical protein PUB67_02080 [Clostridiales bacterium]|nr:hypothetical protein [Clostridiales bacterium]